MATLKPGTLCVIIAGCPENIGVIVEVIRRYGRMPVDFHRIVSRVFH